MRRGHLQVTPTILSQLLVSWLGNRNASRKMYCIVYLMIGRIVTHSLSEVRRVNSTATVANIQCSDSFSLYIFISHLLLYTLHHPYGVASLAQLSTSMADYRAARTGPLALEEAQLKRVSAMAVADREALAREKVRQAMRQLKEDNAARIAAVNQPPVASGTTNGEDTSNPIDYSSPPTKFLDANQSGSNSVEQSPWLRLTLERRKVYQAAVKSYEDFCHSKTIPLYPASCENLEEWVTQLVHVTSTQPLSQSKAHTALSYLSALRSYHEDLTRDSLKAFENPRLENIISRAEQLLPHKEALR